MAEWVVKRRFSTCVVEATSPEEAIAIAKGSHLGYGSDDEDNRQTVTVASVGDWRTFDMWVERDGHTDVWEARSVRRLRVAPSSGEVDVAVAESDAPAATPGSPFGA